MKILLIPLSVSILFYSSINNANDTRCQHQITSLNKQVLNTEICIEQIIFQPFIYKVKINDDIIYTGTDFTSVIFNSQYKKSQVSGGCFESIKLFSTIKMKKIIKFSKLTKKFTTDCSIHEMKNGESSSFLKTPECSKFFYKATKKIEDIFPIRLGIVCTIKLGDKIVFNKSLDDDIL